MQKQIAASDGRLTALLKDGDDTRAIENVFLATVCRPPSEGERAAISKALASDGREPGLRDLFWALVNSKEFAFNH